MKTKIFFIILLSACFFPSDASAQCKTDTFVASAVAELTAGFNFLKSYKIEGEPDLEKVEFSYVLTKGAQYMFTLKDANNSLGIIVTLYDAQRNKIASSKIGGALVSAVSFPCNASGIYYIQYTFEPGSTRCGGGALAFKR